VIFGAGVITGGLTVRLKHRIVDRLPPAPVAAPWMMQRLEFLRRAQAELRLAPHQRERIDAIFRDSRERMQGVWEKVAPEAHQEVARVREQIRDVLTREQRQRFERIVREQSPRRNGEPRRRGDRWEEERPGPLRPRGAPAPEPQPPSLQPPAGPSPEPQP
jgi:hypothetical protein